MSSKLEKAMEPYLITEGDHFTGDEFKELASEVDGVLNDVLEEVDEPIMRDDWTFTVGKPVPIEKSAAQRVYYRDFEGKMAYVPKDFLDRKTLLKNIFGVIEVDGEYFVDDSPLLAKDEDTGDMKRKDKMYKTISGSFHSTKENIVWIESEQRWAHTDNVVETVDTGEYEFRRNCYQSDDTGEWYRYAECAPETPNRVIHFDHRLPVAEEGKTRRIGIEFEFGNTAELCQEVLKRDRFRKWWATTRDGSLDPISDGCEFISNPMELTQETFDHIRDFLQLAKDCGATIHDVCGYHVHHEATDYNFMKLSSLVSVCKSIEEEIFQLVQSDRSSNRYCRKLDERFAGFLGAQQPKDKEEVGAQLYQGMRADFINRHERSKYVDAERQRGPRYYWLNIDRWYHVGRQDPQKKTVEFRQHEATWDVNRFLNFVMLTHYITQYAKRHSIETCKETRLDDVVEYSKPIHRKQLRNYTEDVEPQRNMTFPKPDELSSSFEEELDGTESPEPSADYQAGATTDWSELTIS